MTIEQLDHLKIYIRAVAGALSIQQDAIENENWARVWDTNRDMVRVINKLDRLTSKVKI